MSTGSSINPLQQFKVETLIPLHIGGVDLSFTNAALWMMIAAATLCLVGFIAARSHTIIPKRLPYVFEALHNFVAGIVRSQLGRKGYAYVNYVFPLFLFILTANVLGILPYSFTVTSQLCVTFALSLTVCITATIIGVMKHKSGFLRTFYPKGTPGFVAPILVPIEILAFLTRPISLGARLFANMVAGHVMIKIFAAFVGLLLASPLAALGVLPLLMNTILLGFEIMVAVLQAYVFTVLTCIYLNDAVNLH
jgi:F-type H+-transporting ATPase subunit a